MSRGISNITKPSMDRRPKDLEVYSRQTNDWGSRLPFGGVGFKMTRASSTSLAGSGGGTVDVSWTATVFDTDGFRDPNSTQVKIPVNCGGWYVFTSSAYITSGPAGLMLIRKNGEAIGRASETGSGAARGRVASVANPGATSVPASSIANISNVLTYTMASGRNYDVVGRMRAVMTASGSGDCYLNLSRDGVAVADNHQYISSAHYASIYMTVPYVGDGVSHNWQLQFYNGTPGVASVYLDAQGSSGLSINDMGGPDNFVGVETMITSHPVLCQPGDLIDLSYFFQATGTTGFANYAVGAANDELPSLSGFRLALP